MTKKVLIIMSCYHPIVGGIETVMKCLAEFLVKKGIEVTVLTKKRAPELAEAEILNGVQVLRTQHNIRGLLKKANEIKGDYDVVLLGGQLSNVSISRIVAGLLFGVYLKLFFGKKVMFLPSSSGVFYDQLLGKFKRVCLKLIGFLSSVVCLSEEQKSFFVSKPMVVLDTPWGPPRAGGIQTASLNLSKKLKDYGFSPVILTRKDEANSTKEEIVDDVKIIRTSVLGVAHLVEKLVFILKNMKNIDTYIIYGSYEKDLTPALAITSTLLRIANKKVMVRFSIELGGPRLC